MNKKELKESLMVFSFMTGILLPVRLFFVSYVSDGWLGSFGVIFGISITIIVLVKKKKLGKFGKIFDKQIIKFQSGRRGKIIYCQAVLFLLILGGTIYAIEMGNSEYLEIKESLLEEHEILSNPDVLLKQTEKIEPIQWLYGVIGLFLAVFIMFPQVAAIFALLNDTFDGWILHFYTVAFVEYLEIFGIMVFYKILSKRQSNDLTFEHI